MKYEEMLKRVIDKLEDTGYDCVEEWAEAILKSIGIKKENPISVKYCGEYKDGGTIEYWGFDGKRYFVDRRRGTETPDKIYDRYPGDKDAKILENIKLVTNL